LNTQIIFVEDYITRNFSLCKFFQSPFTSRHLGQNIFLGTNFANICSAFNVIHINIKQQNNYDSVYFNLYRKLENTRSWTKWLQVFPKTKKPLIFALV
jgi:hypothetical protein